MKPCGNLYKNMEETHQFQPLKHSNNGLNTVIFLTLLTLGFGKTNFSESTKTSPL